MTADATSRARSLRRRETDAEHKLWLKLRDRRLGGHKFVRQLPVGAYFCDFACRDAKLIVELDGSQHVESTHDVRCDATLNEQGFAVLRFWIAEVTSVIDSVCETILAAIDGRLESYDRYTVPSSAQSGTFSPAGRRTRDGLVRGAAERMPSPRRGDEGSARPASRVPSSDPR